MQADKRGATRTRSSKTTKRRASKRRPDKDIIDRLGPEEAHRVLRELLAREPSVRPVAIEIATAIATQVDARRISETLAEALSGLDIEDIGGRAGRKPWGYVEPTEVAWELLRETVDPFVEDVVRLAELGHERAAAASCRGVLLGLYSVRDEQGDAVLGWASDFPQEAAAEALAAFKRALGRSRAKADLVKSVTADMPEWSWLDREARRK